MKELFTSFPKSLQFDREFDSKIYNYIFSFNLRRGFYLLAINTLISSLLITYFTLLYNENHQTHQLVAALLCLLLMFLIFVFFWVFHIIQKKPTLYHKKVFIPLFLIPNLMMLMISLEISLLARNVMIFFCFIMLISTFLFITPLLIFLQCVVISGVYILLAPYHNIRNTDDYLTTLLVILVSSLVSYTIYTNKKIEYQLFSNFKEKNLVLKESNKELSEYSYSDALTGVNNRRRIEDLLKTNWKYCKINNLKLSLIFIDIDNFKKYNDTYGHLQGDQCLVQVATTIETLCNQRTKTNYCAMGRYGGEEFVVILPNTDKKTATELALQFCKSIESLNILHVDNESSSTITISCGVTTFVPDDNKRILFILETADRALYHVKRNGKNNAAHYEDIFLEF